MHSVLSRVTKVTTFYLVALYHTSFDRVLHSRERVSHRAICIYNPPAAQWDRQCLSINHQTWWILVTISAAYHKVEAQERRKKSQNRQTLLERSTSVLQVYADNRKKLKICHESNLESISRWYTAPTLHCHCWGKTLTLSTSLFSMISKDTDTLWINI